MEGYKVAPLGKACNEILHEDDPYGLQSCGLNTMNPFEILELRVWTFWQDLYKNSLSWRMIPYARFVLV